MSRSNTLGLLRTEDQYSFEVTKLPQQSNKRICNGQATHKTIILQVFGE